MATTKFPTRWIETSDGFLPAPDNQQPTSILHKQVLDAVDEFKITSFDAWAMDLCVTVGKTCNVITWECTPDPTKFKFAFDWGRSRDVTLSTRVDKDEVQVYLDNKWTALTAFLNEEVKANPTNPNRCRHLSPENMTKEIAKVQRDWWSNNKKKFPFFDLPGELRNEIYRHAAPQDAIEPYAAYRGRSNGMPWVSYRNEMVSNLLKCNKVVAREMRSYMFLRLPLLITHQRLLKKTLRENPFFPFEELTRLTLSFNSHYDLFKLFGLRAKNTLTGNIIDVIGSQHTPLALSRSRLPAIKKLEIVIPSRDTLNNVSFLSGGCQTDTTTMLLEIMEPFIKGQPLVLTGMIKKWQKKLWEAKAAQAHKEYEESWADTEEGGVPVTDEDIARYERDNEMKENDEESESGEEAQCDPEYCANCDSHPGEFSYSDKENDDEDEEEEEEEEEEFFEYHLPFVCRCHPPCLEGEWTDADNVKDREEGASGQEVGKDGKTSQ
ncbi:hypothetical protein D6C92_10020 [Aureobasidium pullulans]|nr:hypothetical protein D6C92_10020 [Aureobasidium pullulans]